MGKYRKAVFVVTYAVEKDRIYYLVLKRKLHWIGWEFPKGGLEKGENIINTVKREVIEETGLIPIKIKNFNFSGKYKYKKRYPERPEFIGQTYSLYSTEVKKQNVSIDQREHSTYKWVSYAQAMKMLKHSNQKTCLKKVNDWLINKPE